MEQEEFDETTIRKAYLEAMKLQRSGLDNETIYARLEKQGIPEQLILRVLGNLRIEQRKKVSKAVNFNYKVAAFKVGAGIVAAVISGIIMPGNVFIPLGLILGGIVLAVSTNKLENEQN